MGELKFFFGLQIKQLEDGTFINQQKYIHNMFKKFGMENSKLMATHMATNVKLTLEGEGDSFDSTKYLKGTKHLGLWYPKFTGVDIMCFADSDHGGSLIDQKSTSGVCAFVGLCLTSWFSKKQTLVAVDSLENIPDIFTKPLKKETFTLLRNGLGMMELEP
ncbi:uncharacterized mitochondrial protein AtMg00810-like [Rutidosis leptorrhynchoides]|uniref:uncharacterized mitochondrial protein AtMg00810-like n=1 Tax=Rutidosis leptorrhynchoides TaxID=125765 RepID=UPI003A9A2B01